MKWRRARSHAVRLLTLPDGRCLFVRDAEAVVAFAPRVAREYEDDILHAAHAVA